MTDPVKGISGTQGTTAGGSYSGGSFSDGHKKRGATAPQADLIEISVLPYGANYRVHCRTGSLETTGHMQL